MEVISKYLTEAEQRKLLSRIGQCAAVLARRDYAWISLLRDTGLRINEFRLTDVGDARAALRDGRLFIPKEHRKGGKRDHDVLVTEPVRTSLSRLLAICAEMSHCTEPALEDHEPLVISRKGMRLSVRSFENRLKIWCKAAGVTTATPHWLRHTRAMNIMRRSTHKDPRGIVQVALGHADIRSTGIYTKPSREDVDRELQLVDGGRRASKSQLRRRYENRTAA